MRYIVSHTVVGQNPALLLSTLNYGNYGIFLIMGHAGFCPSTVVLSRSSKDEFWQLFRPLSWIQPEKVQSSGLRTLSLR